VAADLRAMEPSEFLTELTEFWSGINEMWLGRNLAFLVPELVNQSQKIPLIWKIW